MDISLLVKSALVATAIAAFAISHYVFKAKDDSPIEEMAEEIIEQNSNVKMDLTPESKEKK